MDRRVEAGPPRYVQQGTIVEEGRIQGDEGVPLVVGEAAEVGPDRVESWPADCRARLLTAGSPPRSRLVERASSKRPSTKTKRLHAKSGTARGARESREILEPGAGNSKGTEAMGWTFRVTPLLETTTGQAEVREGRDGFTAKLGQPSRFVAQTAAKLLVSREVVIAS